MSIRASVEQLDQMTRILVLRLSHTTRAYQQQRTVVEEHQQSVTARRQEVHQLDCDRESVVRYLNSPEVASDPVKLSDADIRRRWLVYDREKAAYFLDLALEDLAEAEADLAKKKQAWLKAQARETQTREQRSQLARQRDLETELKDSLEVQELLGGRRTTLG